MDFLGIGPMEILLILIIGFIVFGPQKLPDIAKGLGKAVREFKKQRSMLTQDFKDAYEEGLKAPPETQAKSPQIATEILNDNNAAPAKTEGIQPQNPNE